MQRKALSPVKTRINARLKEHEQYINYGAAITGVDGSLRLVVRKRKPNGAYVGPVLVSVFGDVAPSLVVADVCPAALRGIILERWPELIKKP
jgi:hypothetical protein